jgi:hypothetical protein
MSPSPSFSQVNGIFDTDLSMPGNGFGKNAASFAVSATRLL